uniref:Retinal G-protein-coupled receptor n=1 Tax=Ciona intestinalis TaxID=7719 RepID=F6VG01_CIOIN
MEVNDKRVYGVLMGLLGLLTITGYSLLFVIFAKRPDLKKKNKFLLSLATSDLLITVHVFASTIAAFAPQWPFGDLGCQVDAFIGMAPTFISIAGAALIAKDKYYRFCKPKMVGRNYSFHVYLTWTMGIIGGALPFIGFGRYGFETDDVTWRTGCLLDFKSISAKYSFYIILISTVWFVWPVYKLVSSYMKISTKINKFYPLLFVVPVQMAIGLLPYAIYAMVSITIGVSAVPYFCVVINNLAAKVFVGSNPFIYIYFDPELRESCKQIFCSPPAPTNDKISEDSKDE